MSVQVAVVGLGAFGQSHLRAFAGLPGVRVAAVCSRNRAHAETVARNFGVPLGTNDLSAILDDPAIDAVTICTDEHRHLEPAIAAIHAGKHVLIEKPLAATGSDARIIRDAAAGSDRIVMPGHICRFEPRFAAMRRAVTSGDLGHVASVSARRNRPRSTQATYGRCHPALVTMIHDLDIVLWTLRERPARIIARQHLETDKHGRYGIWAWLEFPSGAIATLEASWMEADTRPVASTDRFSVLGTRGSIDIDMADSGYRAIGSSPIDAVFEPDVHGVTAGALRDELAHFVRRIGDPSIAPVVTLDDGVAAVEVAESIIAAAGA